MPPAAGELGSALERSERRKQSAAERLNCSNSGDKEYHKSSVVDNTASAPRVKNSFLQRSRSGCGGDHNVKRSESGHDKTLLFSSSPPARAKQDVIVHVPPK